MPLPIQDLTLSKLVFPVVRPEAKLKISANGSIQRAVFVGFCRDAHGHRPRGTQDVLAGFFDKDLSGRDRRLIEPNYNCTRAALG